ncbi:hypothetical protein LTR91_008786 [Friedmanniomyces endolithicus]|uniref:Uncharacterized protein n=1 Tax=Friedmanniomyces endolithicus TaxID=329885 RepID=A0AAN6KNU6_9PEZI|nr:hypothetical protein LTR35_007888 [Friedmanniomyces endolithicus]KAK0280972.1 hypothetical protein LTS00_012805 [Friedmanniomyces endolithicus]KAK0309764.1 hypothetical protein LTR01_003961 [Friedmanniomyces endolithicus]KAK0932063.1 hypothetical protein LTR57_000283 [Friedmanniomyces endolithicus]KAK0990844.1 hypothetical protein LTR91_008786 [Friedmanniomyces endolithicus]
MANENVRDMSKLSLASDEGESGSAPSRASPPASGTTPRGGQKSEPSPSPPPGHMPALSWAQALGSQQDGHAQSGIPNGHSQPARNFHGMLEEASRKAKTHSATYATVNALHLLSGTVSIGKGFDYLQQARQTIDEASRAGDTDVLRTLREKTAELQALYEKENAGVYATPWPDNGEEH